MRRPLGMVGLVVLVLAVLDTILAPLLVPVSALHYNLAAAYQGWRGTHLLGTDELGRDELARVLLGVHGTILFTGTALGLAVVAGAIVLSAVSLFGRTRRIEWVQWAEVPLTPVIAVVLLLIWAHAVQYQFPQGSGPYGFATNLVDAIGARIWSDLRHLSETLSFIGQGAMYELLLLLLIPIELLRFGYLLIAQFREHRHATSGLAVHASSTGLKVSSILRSSAGPAGVVGLWVAGDTLLVEPVFGHYSIYARGSLAYLSLGNLATLASGSVGSGPALMWLPIVALVIVFVSFNLVGFELRRVLQRAVNE
jgi:ABC-type dipeptide/oligopeptide/nickel transport system permease subunit